jgi:hypothetical protein
MWVMHSHTIDTRRENDLWRAIGLARSLATGPERTRNRREPSSRTLSAGAKVIIAEGVGATAPGHQEVRPHFGIWLHLESNIRRYRALTRDGDLYRPYWQLWAEQEERLFAR